MKFIDIMRRLFLLLIIALAVSSARAQVNSNSPYSSYGIGDQNAMDHATMVALGNSNITVIDSTTLNFYNPASYNRIAAGQVLFSLSSSTRLSNYSEGTENYFGSLSTLQHFAMAFPFKQHFGVAFGLKPYSRTGYDISNFSTIGTDTLKYNYSGTGGFNEVFLGFSADLLGAFDLKKTQWSVGGNLGYLFGSSANKRTSVLNDGNVGGVDIRSIRAKSIHYTLGTYLSHNFSPTKELTLSATYDPSQNLNADFTLGRFYSPINVNDPDFYDTLQYIGDSTGNIASAPTFTIGGKYTLRRLARDSDNKKLNSEVSFHATYSSTKWADFSVPFDTNFTNYLNTTKYTFGIQYIPEMYYIRNRATTKFYERLRYRIGGYYQSLPYQANSEQVTDFGTTFGIGIPIAIQKSVSSLNLGFSMGQRGTADSQALKERYYGINVGITIAPGGDRWFVKRKLN